MRRPGPCWPWGTRKRSGIPRPSQRFVPSSAGGKRTPRRCDTVAQAPRLGRVRRTTHNGKQGQSNSHWCLCGGRDRARGGRGPVLWGGGTFFQEKVPYVIFFESSVE